MAITKIKVEFDAMKKDALELYTKEQGIDITIALQKKLDELYNEHVPEQTKKFINHLSGNESIEEEVTSTPPKRKTKTATKKMEEAQFVEDIPITAQDMTLSQ